jgi:small subunit ribosomal protein S17
MDKTVVVSVERMVQHPQYGKYLRVRKKFKAHDAENACEVGDKVMIRECRPLSKEKRWKVIRILGKAKALEGAGNDSGEHHS